MLKMKTCLKGFFSIFIFLSAIFFVFKTNAYAAASTGDSSGLCTLGDIGTCPNIGSFTCTNGDCEIWPAQAYPCECSIPVAGINKGNWTTCDYPSAEFYDFKGSCANDNLYQRKCSFTSQSIACNSSSVSVKYTCGSWEKVTYVCSLGTVQYSTCNTCGTMSRTCQSNGMA